MIMHHDLYSHEGAMYAEEESTQRGPRLGIGVHRNGHQPCEDASSSNGDGSNKLSTWIIDAAERYESWEQFVEASRVVRLGAIVKEVRQLRGIDRDEFALRLDVPRTYIVALENGVLPESEIRPGYLSRLAETLNLPLDVLTRILMDDSPVVAEVSSSSGLHGVFSSFIKLVTGNA